MFINPMTTPTLMAEKLQIDERFLNNPDQVAAVMQDRLNNQPQPEEEQPQ